MLEVAGEPVRVLVLVLRCVVDQLEDVLLATDILRVTEIRGVFQVTRPGEDDANRVFGGIRLLDRQKRLGQALEPLARLTRVPAGD